MRLASSLALACVLGLSSTALAQPTSGTIFLSGGGLAAIEKSSTTSGFGLRNPDGTDAVAGGTLGVGVYLTPRVSARVEWSMTGTIRQTGDVIQYPYYPPEVLARMSGGIFALPEPQSLIPYVPESRRSTAAGFALLGYHLAAGRASIELLAGVGVLSEHLESRFDVRVANPPTNTLLSRNDYESTTYNTVPVVGADVAIALFSRAALVPQVRVYAYPNRVSIRPGLGVRWTF